MAAKRAGMHDPCNAMQMHRNNECKWPLCEIYLTNKRYQTIQINSQNSSKYADERPQTSPNSVLQRTREREAGKDCANFMGEDSYKDSTQDLADLHKK